MAKFGDDFVSEYYRAKVGAAAEEMNGGIFLNEDVYHAWYLFKVILQRAPKNKYPIRIICGQLRKDFYESLGPYADDAMKKGCSLDVYVTFRSKESLREESNQFAQMLESSENGNLYCNDEGKDMESVPHMILAGEKGEIFRYETDNKEHKALVAFGETNYPENFGESLVNNFNDIVASYWNPVPTS